MNWLDKQIEAAKISATPFDENDKFYIINARGSLDNTIHIYGIENLAKELHRHLRYEFYDNGNDMAYFTYKHYKFFGLVKRVVI